jgi:cell division protein FtsB
MKRPNFSLTYALVITSLVLLVYMVIAFNGRMQDLRSQSSQHETAVQELAYKEGRKAALETQIAHSSSDEAVYRWAYEDGHMVRSGDFPIVPIAPAVKTPVPTPKPHTPRRTYENWEIWIWLFVDNAPTVN